MSVDIASLVIEIDSTQAVAAVANLDKLTAAGERAQGSAGRVRTATEQAGIGIKQSADASAAAARSATELANSQGAVEQATRQAAAAWMSAKTANAAVVATQQDMVRQVAATSAELGVYQAKMLAATMAQTGMTEAQAAVALGFREAATAEKAAGAVSAETRAARALDAAAMRELVKASKDFERDTVASANAAAAGEAAASAERTRAIMADRALEAAAQRELVAASKAYDRDMAAAQKAADVESAASAKAEAEAQAAAAAEVVAAQRARTAAIMEARSLEAAAQRESVLASKQFDAAQVASAREAATLAAQVDKIRVALDPMAASQLKAAANTATLNAALEKGVITEAEYITITRAAAAAEKEAGAVSAAASAVELAGHSKVVGSSIKVRESLVLMREAARGDLTRMAGSASILAGAFGLMTTSVLATVAAVALLAAPFVILAVAMLKGADEISKFNGSLIATGGYSGLTADNLDHLAKSISASSDTTIGSTRKTLEALAATGKFGKDALTSLADAAQNYAHITDENAEKFVKEYDGMKDHLVQWAVKHEDVYHDLTLLQIDHIALLVKTGQESRALDELSADIDAESKRRAAEKMAQEEADFGWLQTAMRNIKENASAMWDAILGLGRPQTPQETLGAALDKLARDSAAASVHTPMSNMPGAKAAQAAALQADLAAVNSAQAAIKAADDKAAAEADAAAKRHNAIQAKYGDGKAKATKADPVAERLQALAAEAQGNRLLATSTDLTTEAGVKAVAMQKALADAAKTSRAGTDQQTLAQKFYAAELAVVVTAAAKQAETEVAASNAKSKATEQATGLVQSLGVSQGVANQMVADSNELAKLHAAYDAASLKDKPALAKAITDTAMAQERKNLADQAAFLAQSHQGATDQLDQLRLEATLIGATNEQRAVALAQLKAEQNLRANNIHPMLMNGAANPLFTQAVADAGAVAKTGAGVTNATDRNNSQLTAQLHLFQELQTATAAYGQGLTDVFGKAGTAISNVTSIFLSHAAALADIAVQQEAVRKSGGDPIKEAELSRQAADLQVQAYADVLGAAASAFGKQTAAYKILHGAEEAYRVFQFAMAVKSIFFKGAESAATVANAGVSVASDATTTASTLVTSALKATAHGVVAIARAIASLPFPFNIAAGVATAAALIGFGVEVIGGGGGSSSAVPVDPSDAVQKSQGAGTVLGDTAAKSASIQKALDLVAKNTNQDLEYSNGMLKALRNIDTGITSLTAAIARQIGITGGAFDTSGLGLGTSSKSGFLGIFGGSTTTRTVADQGLNINGGNLAQILAAGIQGATYQVVQSVKTSKGFLGIGGGTKTSFDTESQTLDASIAKNFTDLLGKLRDGVVAAGDAIGVDGAKAILDAFQVNIGKISFDGMSSQDIEDTLNAVFSKVGDQMAGAILPAIMQLQQAGEGAFETLTRVAKEYQVVDVSLQSIGKTFGAVGVGSLAARDALVQLFGSLDDFQSQTQFFADNFLTDAQRIAPIQAAVQKQFASLGVTGVNTKDQFAQLVLGLDLTTDAGRQMYAALLAVAPAFSKVMDFLTGGSQDVTAATDALTKAYQAQVDQIQATISQFTTFADNLKAFRSSLDTGPNALLTPEAQYNATKAAFLDTAAKAQLGDPQALGDLQGVSQSYLDASKAYYASSGKYFQDLDAVKAAVTASQATAQRTVDNATSQLGALNQQIDLLDGVIDGIANLGATTLQMKDGVFQTADNVLTLAAAISAWQAATTVAGVTSGTPFSPLTSATGSTAPSFNLPTPVVTQVTATPTGGVTIPVTLAPPDLAQIQQALGGGFATGGGGGNLSNFGPAQYFATGGSFTVGGTGGTDSQHFGSFMATPGEIVNVRRPGDVSNDNADVVAELKALREETAQLRQTLAKHGEATVATQEKVGQRIERAVAKPSMMQLKAGGRA